VQQKRYRYTGKERDDGSGLCYYGARYLAPWLARWISPDSAGAEGGQERALTINAPPLLSSDFMKNSVLVFNKLSLSTG
jgi:RHS repeat-associated protein